MEKERFCQSCAMPLDEDGALWGREADGSLNADYCKYCYDHGGFTSDVTMEEMINFCVPIMVREGMEEKAARTMMEQTFPHLKRWKR